MIPTTLSYNINQKIQTKKAYFQTFSWFQFYIYMLYMIILHFIAPYTTVLNLVSSKTIEDVATSKRPLLIIGKVQLCLHIPVLFYQQKLAKGFFSGKN